MPERVTKRVRWSSVGVVLLLALVLFVGCGPEPLVSTGTQSQEEFKSDALGSEFVLRIRQPPKLEAKKKYPLVVQLDPTFAGLRQFDRTVGLISHHAAKSRWPEAIVVGLDYKNPGRRFQDYAVPKDLDPAFGKKEGADRLYRAIRDDVLPYLQKKLPIDASKRILVGHSMGAVFAWYAAFRHTEKEPPLFHAYVAADGGIQKELFILEKWHADRAKDLPIRLFATRALYNGPVQQITFDALIKRLKERKFPGLVLASKALETDHGGAITPSYEQGLAHAFGVVP